MTEFVAHVYATFRIPVTLRAADQATAAREAAKLVSNDVTANRMVRQCGEYADEITAVMVDVVGDEEHALTANFNPDGTPLDGPLTLAEHLQQAIDDNRASLRQSIEGRP